MYHYCRCVANSIILLDIRIHAVQCYECNRTKSDLTKTVKINIAQNHFSIVIPLQLLIHGHTDVASFPDFPSVACSNTDFSPINVLAHNYNVPPPNYVTLKAV